MANENPIDIKNWKNDKQSTVTNRATHWWSLSQRWQLLRLKTPDEFISSAHMQPEIKISSLTFADINLRIEWACPSCDLVIWTIPYNVRMTKLSAELLHVLTALMRGWSRWHTRPCCSVPPPWPPGKVQPLFWNNGGSVFRLRPTSYTPPERGEIDRWIDWWMDR